MNRMRMGLCMIVSAAAIGHSIVNGQVPHDRKNKPQTRVVQRNQQPLASRLLPDDDILVVKPAGDPPLLVSFPADVSARQAVEIASQHATAAVVVDVERSESKLVESDTWIATFTSGVIVDVVRPSPYPTLTLRQGGEITLIENAGELAIGGKIVRAGPPSLEPFMPGSRYLVVMSIDPENGKAYPTGRWVVRPDGRLQDTWLDENGPDWRPKLTGQSLDGVVDALRKLRRK